MNKFDELNSKIDGVLEALRKQYDEKCNELKELQLEKSKLEKRYYVISDNLTRLENTIKTVEKLEVDHSLHDLSKTGVIVSTLSLAAMGILAMVSEPSTALTGTLVVGSAISAAVDSYSINHLIQDKKKIKKGKYRLANAGYPACDDDYSWTLDYASSERASTLHEYNAIVSLIQDVDDRINVIITDMKNIEAEYEEHSYAQEYVSKQKDKAVLKVSAGKHTKALNEEFDNNEVVNDISLGLHK